MEQNVVRSANRLWVLKWKAGCMQMGRNSRGRRGDGGIRLYFGIMENKFETNIIYR